MSKKLIPLMLGGILVTVGIQPAFAEFQVNGFASFGGVVTDAPHVPVSSISRNAVAGGFLFPANKDHRVSIQGMGGRPTFDTDTSLGLQIGKDLTEDVSFMSQFVATGNSGDYNVQTSWLFAKYQMTSEWAGRIGRFRVPAYMLSDYLDVRYAYPWVRPPMEVYSQVPFSNITGIDLNFTGTVLDNDLVIQGFYGSANPNITVQGQAVNLGVRDLKGISATYGNEFLTGRLIYANAKFTFNPQPESLNILRDFLTASYAAAGFDVNTRVPTGFWETDNTYGSFQGIGYKFDWNNIYSLGEMVHRRISGVQANLLGSYVLLGYRFGELMPHITYAKLKTLDNKVRRLGSSWGVFSGLGAPVAALNSTAETALNSALSTDQNSITAGLRYDAFAGTAFKAEWQLIKAKNNTGGLFSSNPGRKVNVFSLAMDIVF